MRPKEANGLADRVDPDQTAPSGRSSLIWVYTVCPEWNGKHVDPDQTAPSGAGAV